MVINVRHIIHIVEVVFVIFPIITSLFCMFVGAPRCSREVLRATAPTVRKEVVLFVSIPSHPRRVVSTIAAAVALEVRKVIIVHGIDIAEPGLVFCLWGNSTLWIGAARATSGIPFFTALVWIRKEVEWSKSVLLHPVLVIAPIDAIHFIDEVREVPILVAVFSAPHVYGFFWPQRPLIFGTRKVERPWKRVCSVRTIVSQM
jgi:hypothetical protein